MNPYVLIFVGVGGLAGVAFLSFELLVCRLYSAHHLDWLRDGSPALFGESGFKQTVARWTLQRKLFLSSPDWIDRVRRARFLLLLFRVSSVFVVLAIFGLPVVALLLS